MEGGEVGRCVAWKLLLGSSRTRSLNIVVCLSVPSCMWKIGIERNENKR